ncbi:MAG TPA: SOS response-associated peptidase family protein [Rhizomicrobium sp.]|jgi:putative SOS response-associated peptidase YedK|nr:SOS response-associated peptidase family protein [Rhizomicrobium sp.]
MCGVFTAMASWAEVVDFSQPLTTDSADSVIRYRVGQKIPVVVYDEELSERTVVRMQWGFPNPRGHGFKHMHCRSETIDTTMAFSGLFLGGQRGLVVVRTFNEGREVGSKTEQHTIDPHKDAPMGFAVLWDRFNMPTGELWACVQVTVPANELINSLGPEVDRMPAFIDHADWPVWLGETPASPSEVKALLKTKQGVGWTMSKEQKAADAKRDRRKPTVSDPTPGFF